MLHPAQFLEAFNLRGIAFGGLSLSPRLSLADCEGIGGGPARASMMATADRNPTTCRYWAL